MSKTPRTDAATRLFGYHWCNEKAVPVEFAEELETELAEARAEIERLALLAQNKDTVIAAQRSSMKARDKLIEQMREALLDALREIEDYDNYTADRVKIEAALAAERGEG